LGGAGEKDRTSWPRINLVIRDTWPNKPVKKWTGFTYLQSDNQGLNGDIRRRALDPEKLSRLVAQLVRMLGEREGNVPSATLLD
jgi:hypothetical protein